ISGAGAVPLGGLPELAGALPAGAEVSPDADPSGADPSCAGSGPEVAAGADADSGPDAVALPADADPECAEPARVEPGNTAVPSDLTRSVLVRNSGTDLRRSAT